MSEKKKIPWKPDESQILEWPSERLSLQEDWQSICNGLRWVWRKLKGVVSK